MVGFDTFAGYRSISDRDGTSPFVAEGAYSVSSDYLPHLKAVLDCHEAENPMSHIRKYELVPGDVTETVPDYFRRHPECVVALAYLAVVRSLATPGTSDKKRGVTRRRARSADSRRHCAAAGQHPGGDATA